jgi:hypothetical protein
LCLAGLDLQQKAPTINNCETLKDYYKRLYAQTNCDPFEGTLGDLSKCVINVVAAIYGFKGSCFDTTLAPTMVSTASAHCGKHRVLLRLRLNTLAAMLTLWLLCCALHRHQHRLLLLMQLPPSDSMRSSVRVFDVELCTCK